MLIQNLILQEKIYRTQINRDYKGSKVNIYIYMIYIVLSFWGQTIRFPRWKQRLNFLKKFKCYTHVVVGVRFCFLCCLYMVLLFVCVFCCLLCFLLLFYYIYIYI